ncbi:MAG: glutathione S-transferase family protein [Bradymonadaceae bacterium]
MKETRDLHLISFETCPYVERSRIVLEEKDVEHDLTFIDLSDKPDWFLEISPRGKVPVLLVDDEPIFESNVINELLEELYPDPRMLPEDPVERARHRSWIVFNNDVLMGAAATLWFERDDEDAVQDARERLRDGFSKIDEELADRDSGPYFAGGDFGLVDAVYAPLFNRWEAAAELGHGDLLEDFDQLRAYGDALVQRESVRSARADDLTDRIL